MEATSSFLAALNAAKQQRESQGLVCEGDHRVSFLLKNPIQSGPNGKVIPHGRRVQRRVRMLYVRKTGDVKAFFGAIDWASLVQWLSDHWVDILRILLALLPFLL